MSQKKKHNGTSAAKNVEKNHEDVPNHVGFNGHFRYQLNYLWHFCQAYDSGPRGIRPQFIWLKWWIFGESQKISPRIP